MQQRISRVVVAVALVAATHALLIAQPRAPWAADVDQIFAAWSRPDSPGCALGVFKDGAVAYVRGYGMADLEQGVPITPETVFYVGSLSKQFTAMAAALAIQQGRLSAGDPIRRYLSELPEYAVPITVRHLLHHTSGLRDYNTLLSIAGRRGDEAYDNATVLRMTARQKALNFTPGDEYLYSNTGYTLLATIVERATGTPFAQFADANIFKPLGMTVTHYHVDASRLVHKRASAYERSGNGAVTLDTPSNQRAGAGGVFTNIRDLKRWDENFYTGQVGGLAIIEQLQAPGSLNGGRPLTYAWGLEVGTYRGLRIVEHGGSLGGYRAHLLRFPAQHTSVALLCNLGSIAPSALARRVADAVLGSILTGEKPAPASAAPRGGRGELPASPAPSVTLADYAGSYVSDEIDSVFTIAVDGSRLVLRREADAEPAALVPGGADAFRARGMTLTFERAPDRRVTALLVDAGRVRGIRFRKDK